MIWILDNNPKVCAKYQCDEDLYEAMRQGVKALVGKGKWARWVMKRSQNWMWMFRFTEAIVRRLEGMDYNANVVVLSWIWDHMPVLPCSPRGKKSKFPPHDKFPRTRHRGIPTKRTIHSYRKLFNETKPGAVWFKGTYQPPWYYGDV